MSEFIEYNRTVAQEISESRGMDNFLKGSASSIASSFRCVDCGAWLPSPIVKFFKGNPDEMRCYACQGLPPKKEAMTEESKESESAALVVPPSNTGLVPVANMGEALQAYKQLQQQIDQAMPDCIQEIAGRKFRKKNYWRAVARAFNLNVEMVSEELVKGKKDWGYIVTYRATGPNESFADGDGSCMASEKFRKYKSTGEVYDRSQATIHNVRSHAHTRAFNRAVSNLVGFGEVSAEEVNPSEVVEES